MELDKDGFIELGDTMEADWFFLQQMRAERQKLDAAIERCEAAFRAKMIEAGATGFTIGGVPKVNFKKNGTFPVAKYRDANPAVYAAYLIKVDGFDLATFKRDRKNEYEQWLSHSFKYVQPKKGGN